MNKLISIIVPVYNAEKYIDNCIQSILVQSYKKFELLLYEKKVYVKQQENLLLGWMRMIG